MGTRHFNGYGGDVVPLLAEGFDGVIDFPEHPGTHSELRTAAGWMVVGERREDFDKQIAGGSVQFDQRQW